MWKNCMFMHLTNVTVNKHKVINKHMLCNEKSLLIKSGVNKSFPNDEVVALI